MTTLFKMVAVKGFSNTRIVCNRENGAVLPGDEFETDWLHARDLRTNGLANPAEGVDLDKEPNEPVEPHNQISVPELKKINERRANASKVEEAPKGK